MILLFFLRYHFFKIILALKKLKQKIKTKKISLKVINHKTNRLIIYLKKAKIQRLNMKILLINMFDLTQYKINKIYQIKIFKKILAIKKKKIILIMRNKFPNLKKIKTIKSNNQPSVKNCIPVVHHLYVLISKTNPNKVQPRKLQNKKELSKFEAHGNFYWSV